MARLESAGVEKQRGKCHACRGREAEEEVSQPLEIGLDGEK